MGATTRTRSADKRLTLYFIDIAAAEVESKTREAAAKMDGDWSDLPDGHVLLKMSAALPEIIQETGYSEMYGVNLQVPTEG